MSKRCTYVIFCIATLIIFSAENFYAANLEEKLSPNDVQRILAKTYVSKFQKLDALHSKADYSTEVFFHNKSFTSLYLALNGEEKAHYLSLFEPEAKQSLNQLLKGEWSFEEVRNFLVKHPFTSSNDQIVELYSRRALDFGDSKKALAIARLYYSLSEPRSVETELHILLNALLSNDVTLSDEAFSRVQKLSNETISLNGKNGCLVSSILDKIQRFKNKSNGDIHKEAISKSNEVSRLPNDLVAVGNLKQRQMYFEGKNIGKLPGKLNEAGAVLSLLGESGQWEIKGMDQSGNIANMILPERYKFHGESPGGILKFYDIKQKQMYWISPSGKRKEASQSSRASRVEADYTSDAFFEYKPSSDDANICEALVVHQPDKQPLEFKFSEVGGLQYGARAFLSGNTLLLEKGGLNGKVSWVQRLPNGKEVPLFYGTADVERLYDESLLFWLNSGERYVFGGEKLYDVSKENNGKLAMHPDSSHVFRYYEGGSEAYVLEVKDGNLSESLLPLPDETKIRAILDPSPELGKYVVFSNDQAYVTSKEGVVATFPMKYHPMNRVFPHKDGSYSVIQQEGEHSTLNWHAKRKQVTAADIADWLSCETAEAVRARDRKLIDSIIHSGD